MAGYRAQADVTWKRSGDGIVLLNLASGAVFPLNSSAAFLWRHLMDGHSEAEIVAAIKAKFATGNADVAADVHQQIEMLKQAGVIEAKAESAG